ncbi:MAG: hypothetical protein ACI4HI_07770 [Lachnospiraceae bacterium]
MDETRLNKSVELTDEAVKDVTGGLNGVSGKFTDQEDIQGPFYPCPECGALSTVPHKCTECGWVDPRTTSGGFC